MTVGVLQSQVPRHVTVPCPRCQVAAEFVRPADDTKIACHGCSTVFTFAPLTGTTYLDTARSAAGDASSTTSSNGGNQSRSRSVGGWGKRGTDEKPASMEYYDLFDVPATASADDIRKKYYKLAIKYHPDKNKEPGAEEHFKRISEAYQVLSDPVLRKRYNEYGTTDLTPEGGFTDPEEFFQQQFGGDRFVDIIGKIAIGREFRDLVDDTVDNEGATKDGVTEEALKKRREEQQQQSRERRAKEHAERVRTLVENLTRKLCVFTETECAPEQLAAFRAIQQAEADELKHESHGIELLHAIGYTYTAKANQYLGRNELLGLSGLYQRMREKGHIISETVSTIKSAIELQRSFQQLQQADEAGSMEAAERSQLEEHAARQGLHAMWKGSKLEVQGVLREVCDSVLTDQNVSKEKRKQRALALKVLGEVYSEIQGDESAAATTPTTAK